MKPDRRQPPRIVFPSNLCLKFQKRKKLTSIPDNTVLSNYSKGTAKKKPRLGERGRGKLNLHIVIGTVEPGADDHTGFAVG